MFYKKVNLSKDKEMFDFLKDHYTYDTLNSWNGLKSIANCVKVYALELEGNEWTALNYLQQDDYETVNDMIYDWEYEHKGYSVGFNGRSGGYLVLYNEGNNGNILPEFITYNDNYDEYKEWCKEYQGGVKYNRWALKEYVELVQDFDKLCDEIRDYVNVLSKRDFAKDTIGRILDDFNYEYEDDLNNLGIEPLEAENNCIDYSGLSKLKCLVQAFMDTVHSYENGLEITWLDNNIVKIENN